MNNFVSKSETLIQAPTEKVWQALTDPAMVKQWLFGTEMTVTKWEVGGQIRYKGIWEGKSYEDKGEIVEIVPGQKFISTYWSGMSGKADVPENYSRVSYELVAQGEYTKLIITQDNNPTEESAKHSQENWNMVLDSLKKILEN